MKTIKTLVKDSDKVYILCNTQKSGMHFLLNAEKENLTIGRSTRSTEGKLQDMYCLHSDGTIWYLGWAGHILHHHEKVTVKQVDYAEYIES